MVISKVTKLSRGIITNFTVVINEVAKLLRVTMTRCFVVVSEVAKYRYSTNIVLISRFPNGEFH